MMMGKKMTYLYYCHTFTVKDDESEVSGRSLSLGHDQILRRLRHTRLSKTSESDSTSIKPTSDRDSKEGGRRKDEVTLLVLTLSATENESTPEFLPYNSSWTSEDGNFCMPHFDMGFFKHPMPRVLKLGGHTT